MTKRKHVDLRDEFEKRGHIYELPKKNLSEDQKLTIEDLKKNNVSNEIDSHITIIKRR